jgi:hypothetical protein
MMLGRWGVGQGGHGGARKDSSRRRIVWKWARAGHGERKQLHTYYSGTAVCSEGDGSDSRQTRCRQQLARCGRSSASDAAGLSFSDVAQA